jgi:probable HAF family extracellular repeat protein
MSRNIFWTIFWTTLLSFSTVMAESTFTSFDYPGANVTAPQGINASGAVVGAYVDSAGKQHAFLLDSGTFTSIDYPGALSTGARGINSNGDIVGVHTDVAGLPGGGARGFLLQQGNFTDVNYPGHLNTIPVKVTDDDQVVGCYHDTDTMGTMHGFLFGNGNYSALDGSWDGLNVPASMNNGVVPDGSIVAGLYTDMMTNTTHGYVAGNGVFAPFDFPFSISTAVWDMNPSGELVGVYTDAAKKTHGFLLKLGESFVTFGLTSLAGPFDFVSIDYPGATTTQAIGINSRGDVDTSSAEGGKRSSSQLGRRRAIAAPSVGKRRRYTNTPVQLRRSHKEYIC